MQVYVCICVCMYVCMCVYMYYSSKYTNNSCGLLTQS